MLARHCTEAGLIEKAAGLWGKAGQRSLARSALIEAVAQFTRALGQIATLPATPALRREQIKLQVALANALYHTKGTLRPETKATFEQARVLIEQAETLGEHFEDPLLLYLRPLRFLYTEVYELQWRCCMCTCDQFLALAEQQKATAPMMLGHRLLGNTLLCMGDFAEGLVTSDRLGRFTILPRIGRWRRDLAKTWEWQS